MSMDLGIYEKLRRPVARRPIFEGGGRVASIIMGPPDQPRVPAFKAGQNVRGSRRHLCIRWVMYHISPHGSMPHDEGLLH